ncbi:MAG: anion permease [Deltaproteobacteria bacterium]|nr:anion permease [Deltaproteobacteria bacterium]
MSKSKDVGEAVPFDPLDMKNYALEKLPEMKAGRWLEMFKVVGVPLAVIVFLYFHLKWCGPIEMFDLQTKVKPPDMCYSALGLFLATLVLWISEALPNYLTSLIAIVAAILIGVMKMRPAFAYMGEPVMILNIGSFIMASALVATGLAKRMSLFMVLKMGKNLSLIFLSFLALNVILGAFISATSAKTAILLPVFMVIAAIYGATGGEKRNNVGRNMVLQNLLFNNVSASAFITGSAANLLAAQMLEKAGARVSYGDWLLALLPLAVIQCLIAWWTGTRFLLPISREDAVPHIQGGMQRLHDEMAKLGSISFAEIRAAIVFIAVLALWATESLHGVRAEVVAVGGACAVLLPSILRLPKMGVIKWDDADIPWHMLIFSWGAYVIGGMVDITNIVGFAVDATFKAWGTDHSKVVIFLVLSGFFGITTLINESKTARTIIMFPIMISVAKKFGWDLVGFCLPMAFMINQVYVLYFNSKPANISYLSNQYTMWESFKFGMTQLVIIWVLLALWTQYVMPLMGFNSKLW